jgi:hypothetical protein
MSASDASGMSTSDDRPATTGQPVPPGWDTPPQPPAWDGPVAAQGGWGPPPQYAPGAADGHHTPPAAPAETEGKAIAALVVAICSWVVLPFVAAIVALFLAGAAQRDIDASGGRLSGDGLVTAARVLSWLNIALCVLVVVLGLAALLFFMPVSP